MIKLNDFERAIANYIWAGCDVDGMLEDDVTREITKKDAAEILGLAKKELMREAVEGSVCKQRDSTKATWIELIPDSLPAFDDCEPVKCIILKDDDL